MLENLQALTVLLLFKKKKNLQQFKVCNYS